VHDPGDALLIDVRPAEEFARGHIPGAVHLDLWGVSLIDTSEAPLKAFMWMIGHQFGLRGVSQNRPVVVYEQDSGIRAARAYWFLDYLGHPNAAILDGGFATWVKAGRPVTTDTVAPKPTDWVGEPDASKLATWRQVREHLGDPSTAILDTRSEAEYFGENVRAKRGGSIPGAVNLEWKQNLTPDGHFKSPDDLKANVRRRGRHARSRSHYLLSGWLSRRACLCGASARRIRSCAELHGLLEGMGRPRGPAARASIEAALMLGDTVGRYHILDRIGRGSMGTVYRAEDKSLHREVAIKTLNADLNDPAAGRRFRAEAIAVARLNHPGIAKVYDLFEHDGQWLMAMEFVKGETLESLVARGGPLPLTRPRTSRRRHWRPLAHAHGMGVIHRDLKPANLMVADGRLKITDFGIARVAGHGTSDECGPSDGHTGVHGARTSARSRDRRAHGHLRDGLRDVLSGDGLAAVQGDTPIELVQARLKSDATPIRTNRHECRPGSDRSSSAPSPAIREAVFKRPTRFSKRSSAASRACR
jgi:3-mercaptopyruvate sulfurtransferase SseA